MGSIVGLIAAPTMEPIFERVCFQLSHENGVVIMVNNLNSSCSHVNWLKFGSRHRSFNFRNLLRFKLRDWKKGV
jgi:hypothetical protein